MTNGVFRLPLSCSLGVTLALVACCFVSFSQDKAALTPSVGMDAFSSHPNAETSASVRSGGDLSDVSLYNEAVESYAKGDYEQAVSSYMRACSVYAKACTNLGFMFNNGQGVKKSHLLAAEFYQRGCDNGNALGCTNLGVMYWKAEIPGDYKRAADSLDRGCRGGDGGGCRGLGFLYENGYGVPADKTRAAELYRLANRLARVHQIPFRLQDGMVLISPTLNGEGVLMIVDTASTRTTFNRKALPLSLSRNLPTAVVSTMIGDQKAYSWNFAWNLDGRDINLTSVVGDFKFPSGAVGLLGADMLETFGSVRFDYASLILTLEER